MTQGNGARAVPSHDEVERAIRSVPGVAEATIARAHDTGRGRLRIRLHPGEDAERVSWSVAATLRERFGIALDPEEIRPRVSDEPSQAADEQAVSVHRVTDDPEEPGLLREDPPVLVESGAASSSDPSGGADEGPSRSAATGATRLDTAGSGLGPAPGEVERAWRPAIRDLSSRNDGTAVTVTARLELDGRVVAGEAFGAPTARGLRRAIADATVRAVGELTRVPLRAQVDRVSVGGTDPASVSVVVSLLSGRGEELLLGAAIVRDDVEHAIMRATLDALNRRVEPELVG